MAAVVRGRLGMAKHQYDVNLKLIFNFDWWKTIP
jgi:hypothetical protein